MYYMNNNKIFDKKPLSRLLLSKINSNWLGQKHYNVTWNSVTSHNKKTEKPKAENKNK